WGRVFFDVPLHLVHPALFLLAVPAAVLSLGLMGLLMASSFILYRHANALSNLLEYPVWVATGLLFPLALLPGWVTPLSWLLAPRRGIDAVRHTALGNAPLWFPVAMCAATGAAYLVLAAVFLAFCVRAADAHPTAALPARPRVRRLPDDRVLHDVRDGARVDRPAQQGLLLRRQPRVLPDAALLRREHPALGAARLDERDRALPAAHARDRGRAHDRRRRRARRRLRPALDGARDRSCVRRGRLRALPPARDRVPARRRARCVLASW